MRPQPSQQLCGQDRASFDRERHPQQVGPVILDQLPIDGVTEEIVDVAILRVFARAKERQVLPVADARH